MVCSRFDLVWGYHCYSLVRALRITQGCTLLVRAWYGPLSARIERHSVYFDQCFCEIIYFIRRAPLSHSSLREPLVRRSSKTALFHNGSEWELITLSDTTLRDDTGDEPSSDCKVDELTLAQVLVKSQTQSQSLYFGNSTTVIKSPWGGKLET